MRQVIKCIALVIFAHVCSGDACKPLPRDLVASVAIIERGGCEFGTKVQHLSSMPMMHHVQ
jgi:hypothetical protein